MDIDNLTAEQLRARGSLKWTAFPDADIAAWVAESDLGTAPAVAAALHEAVSTGLLGYLPSGLRQELAVACAQWHEVRYGHRVAPERIHPVADVLEALRVTLAHFTAPGTAVIIPTPAYMPFLTIPSEWGRPITRVPMLTRGPARVDLDGIRTAFRDGARLLVLTNPHNPTGRVFSRDELTELAGVVEECGGLVFADEIHAPLVFEGSHVPYASVSDAAASHTITATSASKAWNIAGTKCAQVLILDDRLNRDWQRLSVAHGAATLGVVANIAAYRDGGPWLADALTYLDGNRHALRRTLPPEVGYRPPEGTYLAWLDLRPLFSELPSNLGRWVRERCRLAVIDGSACAGPGHIRLNLAMPRPMVEEAGRRLAACL